MATSTSAPGTQPPLATSGQEGVVPSGQFNSSLVWISAALCVVCALCVPFTYYRFDIAHCWTSWSEATRGTTPWLPYKLTPDCNYPAFMLYIFTLIEKIRLAAHAPALGKLMLVLFKLPSILAILGGAALCFYGLRRRLGERAATIIAAAYLSCAALWFNAAVWGQFDAILCFGMIGAVIALVNDRPAWCGAALGLALTVKFQAIIILPALGVYWLARPGFGWRATLAAAGGGIAAWGIISAPFFLSGNGHGLIEAYTGAVGFYQELDVYAWNGWYLVHHIGGHLLHLQHADVDSTKLLHLITFKQIGLLVYAAYTAFLLVGLWRRPTRYNALLACTMGAFAFFMLPTEIHERYIVPAVALAALLIPAVDQSRTRSAYALFAALSIIALLEQCLNCEYNYGPFTTKLLHLENHLVNHYLLGIVATFFDLALFIWASVMYWREVYGSPRNAPDLYAPPAANPASSAAA